MALNLDATLLITNREIRGGRFRKPRVAQFKSGRRIEAHRIFPRAATRHEPATSPSRKVNTSSCMFTQVQT